MWGSLELTEMKISAKQLVASVLSAALIVGLAGVSYAQQGEKPAMKEGAQPKHEGHEGKEHKDEGKGKEKKDAKGVKVGDAAPSFSLKDTEGKVHTLSDLSKDGNIVVIQWFNPTARKRTPSTTWPPAGRTRRSP
jgi:hypothetical protein